MGDLGSVTTAAPGVVVGEQLLADLHAVAELGSQILRFAYIEGAGHTVESPAFDAVLYGEQRVELTAEQYAALHRLHSVYGWLTDGASDG